MEKKIYIVGGKFSLFLSFLIDALDVTLTVKDESLSLASFFSFIMIFDFLIISPIIPPVY